MARPGVSTLSTARQSAARTTSSRGRVQKATPRRRQQQSSLTTTENRGIDRNATPPVSQHDQQLQLQIEELRDHMVTRQAELEARIAQIHPLTTQVTGPPAKFPASSAQFPASSPTLRYP
jgi:hypothetical protein